MGSFGTSTVEAIAAASVADLSVFIFTIVSYIVTILMALLALGLALRYVVKHISGRGFGTPFGAGFDDVADRRARHKGHYMLTGEAAEKFNRERGL